MLNFDDLDVLVKIKIKNCELDNSKIIDKESKKFYNSLYNKNKLSSYILVEKKKNKLKSKIKN